MISALYWGAFALTLVLAGTYYTVQDNDTLEPVAYWSKQVVGIGTLLFSVVLMVQSAIADPKRFFTQLGWFLRIIAIVLGGDCDSGDSC